MAKLLAHCDTRVTMGFYDRVNDANERAAVDTMDQRLRQASLARRAMRAVRNGHKRDTLGCFEGTIRVG